MSGEGGGKGWVVRSRGKWSQKTICASSSVRIKYRNHHFFCCFSPSNLSPLMFLMYDAELLTARTKIGMQRWLQFDSRAVRCNPTMLLLATGWSNQQGRPSEREANVPIVPFNPTTSSLWQQHSTGHRKGTRPTRLLKKRTKDLIWISNKDT